MKGEQFCIFLFIALVICSSLEPLNEREVVKNFLRFRKAFSEDPDNPMDKDKAEFASYLTGLQSACKPSPIPLLKILRDTKVYLFKFLLPALFPAFLYEEAVNVNFDYNFFTSDYSKFMNGFFYGVDFYLKRRIYNSFSFDEAANKDLLEQIELIESIVEQVPKRYFSNTIITISGNFVANNLVIDYKGKTIDAEGFKHNFYELEYLSKKCVSDQNPLLIKQRATLFYVHLNIFILNSDETLLDECGEIFRNPFFLYMAIMPIMIKSNDDAIPVYNRFDKPSLYKMFLEYYDNFDFDRKSKANWSAECHDQKG
jgi:hypothetical protein